MSAKHLIIPALLAALAAGTPALAQDRYHDGDRNDRWSQNDRDRGNDRNDHRDDNRNNDWRNNNNGNNGNWRNDRNDGRRDGWQARGGGQYGNQGYGGPGRHWDGAGPDHNFRRGDRLPSNYRNRQYVVDDWRGHHLRQPPRGYHWVQTGGDYVLAAVATGIIADLIINQ